MRPCAKHGCGAPATDHGRCARHRKQVTGTGSRGSTPKWRRLRAQVLRRDKHRCHWCGERADTADHLTPVSEGGQDRLKNLVAACGRCNYGRTPR